MEAARPHDPMLLRALTTPCCCAPSRPHAAPRTLTPVRPKCSRALTLRMMSGLTNETRS
jgi:hypothetical protein